MPADSADKPKSSTNPTGGSSSNLKASLILCAILGVITFVVFSPVRSFDFVRFDDPEYILDNKMVRNGLSVEGFKWAFKTSEAGNWHPLTWLSHMLDHQFFGLKAGKYHLVNVLFHTINAAILLLVLQQMTGAIWRSAFVAALFALHPLHVESVAWISERKDVLSALFCFLTMLFYCDYAKATVRARIVLYYCLSLISCALGLLSKPMLVTLPFVLLLLDFWPLRRMFAGVQPSGCPDDADRLKPELQPKTISHFRTVNCSTLLLEKIPFFALAAALCCITLAVQKGAVTAQMPLSWRIGNALISYGRYVQKMFWPFDLTFLYPHPGKWPTAMVVGSALFLLVASVIALWLGRRHRYITVGWLWYLGTLVPAIGIIQVGLQSMADRYTYIPLIGLFILFTWGICDAFEKLKWPKGILAPAALALLAACTVLTARQLPYWKDSVALYHRSLEVSSRDKVYRQALQNGPLYSDFHVRLCTDLAQGGEPQRAEAYLKEVAQIIPQGPGVHRTLGNALAMQGKWDEAAAAFTEAVRLNPKDFRSHLDLGRVRVMQKKMEEGLEEFFAAAKLAPDSAEVHFNLAMLLEKMGWRKQAETHYRETLRCQPDFEEARKRLASLGE